MHRFMFLASLVFKTIVVVNGKFLGKRKLHFAVSSIKGKLYNNDIIYYMESMRTKNLQHFCYDLRAVTLVGSFRSK